MTRLFQCDVTGNVYENKHEVERVTVGDGWESVVQFDVGPDASPAQVHAYLVERLEGVEIAHPEWFEEHGEGDESGVGHA